MNSHLFLQYGLHDDLVKILPYAVFWIHQLPEYTQVFHDFWRCHLWRRWSLLCKHCVRAWIIFNSVTSEYISAFACFCNFGFQLRILEMTDVPWWRKVHGVAPLFLLHRPPLLFVSDFSSAAMSVFSRICQILCALLLSHLVFSKL